MWTILGEKQILSGLGDSPVGQQSAASLGFAVMFEGGLNYFPEVRKNAD